MLVIGISFEFSRTYFYEGNTTAMIGIHVGVYLEYEPCEVFLFGSDDSFYRLNGLGAGAIFTKQSSNSFTPNIFSAEPKNTGAILAAK